MENSEFAKQIAEMSEKLKEFFSKSEEKDAAANGMAYALGQLLTVWCPDIQRVVDEHHEDIESGKKMMEIIGKRTIAQKAEIAELRNEIELLKSKIK